MEWGEEVETFALWGVVKARVKERERLQKGGKKRVRGDKEELFWRTSYVIYHTSTVTRHTSHITPHTSHFSLQPDVMPVAAATNLIVAKMKGTACGCASGQWVMMKNVTG